MRGIQNPPRNLIKRQLRKPCEPMGGHSLEENPRQFFLGSTLLPSGLKMDRVVIVWENKLAKWVFGSIFEIHWYLSLSNLISRSPFLLVKLPFWRFSHPSNHTACGSRTNSDLPNLIFDKQHLRVSGWKLPPWNCVSPPETADASSRSKYIHSWESSTNVCFLRSGATYMLSQHPKHDSCPMLRQRVSFESFGKLWKKKPPRLDPSRIRESIAEGFLNPKITTGCWFPTNPFEKY